MTEMDVTISGVRRAGPSTGSGTGWFFPLINSVEGLRELDNYLQQNLRFLSTGKHSKANYRVRYSTLKRLGYRSLVHEYYLFKGKA